MSLNQTSSQIAEDPTSTKTAQCTVMCMYQAHIGGYWRTVTALWTKNMMNHSLNIFVDSVDSDQRQNCKIDLKPWHFWGKKSYKTFEVDGLQIDVYWDLRSARFSGSPEPCSDFYVALVCDEEVVLLIGDLKKKVYKRTKSRPGEANAILFFKKEHVFGKKSFTTRAKFDKHRKDYEIVVESSTLGPKDPEMWISIDGIVLIHVRNLQWKFRGNQTVLVNKQPIEVLWDVHAWLFLSPGSSHGLFIFKPGQPSPENDKEENSQDGSEGSDNSSVSKYYSTYGSPKTSQCCLFLYAWKIE
ncbi:hypothetical protein Ccrd_001942 [Cynara cardunculus var. scolymus]|uniref:DUF868 domain-containing protein n=1 Tax=Cynara cardunculus var. scolymus TaxID=59895 RepID=A0A103XSD9_CYNCS|nr:hypothetical protein Ccrd_001942 [Cynara cardunculus var. scolymus]